MASTPEAARAALRRPYLDWLRGLAVLVMIEAHVIDSWTRAADRSTRHYGIAMIVGGFGAPLFLYLAGLSAVLSAAAKYRRGAVPSTVARAVAWRGFEIFLLALLFRIQAWILGAASPWTLLRVDILNIMGPSIAATSALWLLGRTRTRRFAVLAGAAIITACITPAMRTAPMLASLPDPLEAYLRPTGGMTLFAFFPWSAFVFGGAVAGLAIDAVHPGVGERRLNIGIFVGGLLLALGAYAASFLPSPFAGSSFWTSSPAFLFLRLGIVSGLVGIAYAWTALRPAIWSPLEQLGRTSLFIYWIHVEMVYGVLSTPLRRRLPLGWAWVAYAVFCGFMVVCSIAKSRVVRRWRSGQARTGAPNPAAL